jgi:hypothetical protein
VHEVFGSGVVGKKGADVFASKTALDQSVDARLC